MSDDGKTQRWVNPEELINARTSLNQYLDKLNIPNPQINNETNQTKCS